MEKLKRVNQPTTRIIGDIKRFDWRNTATYRALKGDYGSFAAKETYRAITKYPIGAAMRNLCFYLAPRWDGEIAAKKAPIPEEPEILSRHIKRLGYFLRADIVGICNLPQYAVYSHDRNDNPIELNHKFAVVIVIDQDYETMLGSNGYDWISGSQSYIGYSTSAFIASIMADYIRKLGYPALAHHVGTYQVAISPLLLLAGIGEMSRMGASIINPFMGARFKAAAITTDLPLIPDKPVDFGLQEFSRVCKKCAIECPSGAISEGDKVTHNGYETWHQDDEICAKFRFTQQQGSSCGRCVKVCPWNKPQGWTHNLVRWIIQHAPLADGLVVKMDDIWRYGKQDMKKIWWFDFEEIDGILQVPRSKAHGKRRNSTKKE